MKKNIGLVALEKVMELTSLSKSSIDRKMKRGLFPQAYRISERRRAWRLDEVESWISGLAPCAGAVQ